MNILNRIKYSSRNVPNSLANILTNSNKVNNELSNLNSIIKMDTIHINKCLIRKELVKINKTLNNSSEDIQHYLSELDMNQPTRYVPDMRGHIDRY